MQEKTGRVVLGKTKTEDGDPCVRTDSSGEPEKEKKAGAAGLKDLVQNLKIEKP